MTQEEYTKRWDEHTDEYFKMCWDLMNVKDGYEDMMKAIQIIKDLTRKAAKTLK